MGRFGLASKAQVLAVVTAALTCALAFSSAIDGPAVIREYQRMSQLPLWPSFAPARIPVALYDGARTWLFDHPAPPPLFVPVQGNGNMRVFEGRFADVTANNGVKINGIMTAGVLNPGSGSAVRQAALVIHEAFHVYQRQMHPDWSANEADAFLYPLNNPVALQERRLETEALRRALDASGGQSRCWARTALDMRAARFALLPANAVEYERRTELNEGLAQYVEDRAAGETRADLLPAAEFAPDAVRLRAYSIGEALALLLDRSDPPASATQQVPHRFFGSWRDDLDSGKEQFLDRILERRLAGGKGCEFYEPEKRQALTRAQQDVAQLQQRREQALHDFQAQSGWRLVFESADGKLGMQGFDPLNVSLVGSGLILHNRYLKAGEAGASFEMLNGHALTESAGQHPLFSGLRRITITGLNAAPSMNQKDGGVSVSAPGVKADFAKASVSVDDAAKQVTITF